MPRLFVSIELPDRIKDALESLVDEARKQDRKSRLRWARRTSFHVTLQFLGDVREAMIADIAQALGAACGSFPAMGFSLAGFGTFGGSRPRILWAGLEGDLDRLSRLVEAIGVGLEPLGFVPEKRRYSPHITLARLPRKPSREDPNLMGRIAFDAIPFDSSPFEVREIRLMRSELRPEGSRYTTVERFPLGDDRP